MTTAQSRSQLTLAAIVDTALSMAAADGLESLTIGEVAKRLGLSKSGVFSRVGSREQLQALVLEEYDRRFVQDVLVPALREPRGLPRLNAILENWLDFLVREIEQGCLMISGASEYDDRPGALRDAMVAIVNGWNQELLRAIELGKTEGHLLAEADSEQLAFEIYGLMLAMHQEARLLRSAKSPTHARRGLERIISGALAVQSAVSSPSRSASAARKSASASKSSRR